MNLQGVALKFSTILGAVFGTAVVFASSSVFADTSFSLPIAAETGESVRLDPTDAFEADTETLLAVDWSWEQRPATSVANFDYSDVLRPNVTPDVPGTYIARADFSNQQTDEHVTTVFIEIGTGGVSPVARIQARGLPDDASILTLDGSESFDVDGDRLTYSWTVASKPSDALVEFSKPTDVQTSVSFDQAGEYTFALVVQDETGRTSSQSSFDLSYTGEQSDGKRRGHHGYHVQSKYGRGGHGYDDVSCQASRSRGNGHGNHGGSECATDYYRNVAPVASITFDQHIVSANEALVVDPFASTDIDGDVLTSEFFVISAPIGADYDLQTVSDGRLSFSGDTAGDYLLSLRVSDGDYTDVDHLLIEVGSDTSVRPVARISDTEAAVGVPAVLDGTQSYDFDGSAIDYAWALLSRPENSQTEIATPSARLTSFTPDVAGTYVAQLTVFDDAGASVPTTIVIDTDVVLPTAHAGVDANLVTSPHSLNGGNSSGVDLLYYWANIGLLGADELGEISDADAQVASLFSAVSEASFKDVLKTQSVYHLKRSNHDDTCSFDTRVPSDIVGASASERVSVSLASRGRLSGQSVWEIENKKNFTRVVTLENRAGETLGSYSVPGRVSIHVTTDEIQSNQKVTARVDGKSVDSERAKTNSFSRNNPVCSGSNSTVAQLIVSDAFGVSTPDTVFVGNGNLRPELFGGETIEAVAGVSALLDGASYAFDANDDTLTFAWALIGRPEGSAVTVASDPNQQILVADAFNVTPDLAGDYVIQVMATDGTHIAEPAVVVVTVANAAPIANATGDTNVYVNEIATLDGSGSYDPDGNALTYSWSVASAPDDSSAIINDTASAVASFIPDRRGTYVFSLAVSDFSATSGTATHTLLVPNRDPSAMLNGPTGIELGATATYDASGSSDADNDPLAFTFSISSSPIGAATDVVVLGNGQFSFTPDTAGTYTVEMIVSDGLTTSVLTQDLEVEASNSAPILDGLNAAYTVELGLELALTLSGSDPDGDPTSFFTSQLPLPTGITLDTQTGELRFRPEAGQVGSYALTLGITDGTRTDVADIVIDVVDGTASDTSVFGRVLDAEDFANGVETPLVGMPVLLEDSALQTTTDADGVFTFGSLATTSDVLIIDPNADGGPGGYLTTERAITITENQNRDLSPEFLLTAVNEGCAIVVAGQDTVLNGALTGIQVSIEADSIFDAAGEIYAGEVCLGSLPQQTPHASFDEDTLACQIYGLSAPGATFSSGVSLTSTNFDNLPEATNLELWLKSGSGNFRRTSPATVDAGAVTVSSTTGTGASEFMFTFLPQAPKTELSDDQPTGNYMLSAFDGNVNQSYMLPGYFAFNQQQDVALSYNSATANPNIILAGDVTISENSSLPVSLSTRIDASGLNVNSDVTWTPRTGANGQTPALVGEAVTLRQSAPFDATGVASGRYPYTFVSKAHYDCSTVSAQHDAEVYIQNDAQSPYGAGWSVDGLQKLTVDPDGGITVIDGLEVSTFEPKPTLSSFDGETLTFEGLGVEDIGIADVDGNGFDDIVFPESGTGSLSVLLNFGDRKFERGESIVVGPVTVIPEDDSNYSPNLRTAAVGDFSGDGFPDIAHVSVNYTYFTYGDGFGLGLGDYTRSGRSYSRSNDFAVTDVNNDGLIDLVEPSCIWCSQLTQTYDIPPRVWFNTGTGNPTISNLPEILDSYKPLQVVAGDIDNNGFADIMYRSASGIYFQFNQDGTNFVNGLDTIDSAYTNLLGHYADFSDVNGDGYLDVILSEATSLSLFINEDGQTFGPAIDIARPAEAGPKSTVNFVDADKDGNVDILLTSEDVFAVYNGLGDGTFLPHEEGQLSHSVREAIVVDLDQDGSDDLVSNQIRSVSIDFSDPTASGLYIAGNGEFSELTKLADGTWERRYKDGTKVLFDANGLQTATVDTHGNSITYAYTPEGALASKTDQAGGVTAFAYYATGQLQSITYPDGRTTEFEFNNIGELVGIEEPTGSVVRFAYDDNNQLVSTTNQNGNSTSYDYDDMGNLSGSTLPDGSSISTQIASSLGLVDGLGSSLPNPLVYVEPEDRVTQIVDRKGNTSEIIVNAFGATVQVTDPLGRVTRISRADDNVVTQVARPSEATANGVRVDAMQYDNNANVTLLTEAVGTEFERSTAYEYEPEFNKVTRKTDADGFVTQYEYDEFGVATSIVDAEGGERTFAYNALGKLIARTDENGNATVFDYGQDENLARIEYADGSVSTMDYDASGNIAVVSEAVGTPHERQVQRTYDALNRVLTVELTGADGIQIDGLTEYSYLPAGNLGAMTDETGLVTSMGYDALERLIALDDPTQGLIQRVYNEAGEVEQYINGDGETYEYGYDAVSRLTETTDPLGYVKSFGYDARDNVKSVVDGRGGVTTFGFDALDRMTSRTNPIGETMTRAYDLRDNLDTLIREDGVVETATYDGLGRRTAVITPDNTLSYAYDQRSNLIEAADDDSRVTFTYDERNRLQSTTTDGSVGPQPEVTISYAYDELDRRTSMSDSLGGTTNYAYDFEDRLTDLTAPWGTIYSFGYDGEGRRTSLTSTSGRATSYEYTNGLLSALNHAQFGVQITDLHYAYDIDGQLSSITDNLDPTKSLEIIHDDLNRLTQVAEGIPTGQGGVPIPIEDYAYDEEGNRLASHLSTLYLSNEHNQLLEDDSYTYDYDQRGNRVARTDKTTGAIETYGYDSQNRLISYASDTTSATYAYDALERRIAKTVDSSETAYIYDTNAEFSLETDNITLEFTENSLVRRWSHSFETDEPLGFEAYTAVAEPTTGSAYTIFSDRQGAPLKIVEQSTGSLAAEYRYSGYGDIEQTQGALVQPYGYTGREYDPENGLYHYRARSYDPKNGVFLQSDPTGFGGDQENLYTYVANNPFGLSDPSGLAVSSDWVVATSTTATMGMAVLTIGGNMNNLADNVAATLGGLWDILNQAEKDAARYDSQTNQDDPNCYNAKVLKARAEQIVNQLGQCKAGHTVGQRILRYRAYSELAAARRNVLTACHGGKGDDGHNDEIRKANKSAMECGMVGR